MIWRVPSGIGCFAHSIYGRAIWGFGFGCRLYCCCGMQVSADGLEDPSKSQPFPLYLARNSHVNKFPNFSRRPKSLPPNMDKQQNMLHSQVLAEPPTRMGAEYLKPCSRVLYHEPLRGKPGPAPRQSLSAQRARAPQQPAFNQVT